VIFDTKGNIFGGFTPVKWESRVVTGDEDNSEKADPILKSFLFTLKNRHNIPARRFPLNEKEKHQAIECDEMWGPCFGSGYCDIAVSDKCNIGIESYTAYFGSVYKNDTGLNGKVVFTGLECFTVEVFEITD
jgi:hypothetical protein